MTNCDKKIVSGYRLFSHELATFYPPITISHIESYDKNYVVFFFGGTIIFFFIHASHKHTIFSYLSIYTIQNRDLVSILSYYSTSNMEFGNNMVLAAYSPLCPNI